MKFILSPLGSAGDVHPMIGLGEALRDRGHEVVMVVNGYFEELTRRVGLQYVEFGSRELFLELANHPDLWHPRRAFSYLFEVGVKPWMREQHRIIAEHFTPDKTILIGSCLGIGARIAHDHLRVPLVTLHMQPAVLWSRFKPPILPGPMRLQQGAPGWLRNWCYRVAERFLLNPVAVPAINEFRRELSLPPIARLTDYWHSPQFILCLFPDWFAPVQPDWPRPIELTHFPLWDERGISEFPLDLEEFLAAGEPPIAFTPGSAMMFGKPFFHAAAEACRRLKRRGLLLSRFTEHLPSDLPEGVRHVAYAPFSQLLPRCAATVHHGGIGSTAQGLSAGIPQLIMPMAHDQPDNAWRLKRLGVGDWLRPAAFRPASVAAKLDQLLHSSAVAESCRHVAARFVGRNGLQEACVALEEFADRVLS
jgi:rhamnosyltransferase subunit B